MKWQSMDSSPKDGSPVLLYEQREDGVGYIFTGYYCDSRNVDVYGTKWACLEYDAFNHNPTYWMPLPNPPEEVV
jgi:hypothetical protein